VEQIKAGTFIYLLSASCTLGPTQTHLNEIGMVWCEAKRAARDCQNWKADDSGCLSYVSKWKELETNVTCFFKGVCQVLLRLEITKPRISGKLPNKGELSAADKLANLTEDRHRKTSYSASKLRHLPTRRSTVGEFNQWWSKDNLSVLVLIQC